MRNRLWFELCYRAMYALVWLLSRIPFRAGQMIGRGLGRACWFVLPGRARVASEGLRRALGGQLSEGELRDLERRILVHFAQLVFEVPHILRLNRRSLGRYVRFEHEERLFEALGRGKGVFVLTGHFGNWEFMAAALSLILDRTAVVARPIDFPPADRLMTMLRSHFGTEIIPKQRGLRKILKAVADNLAVGILLDQNVAWYEGVFVPFLGIPACTNKGLALMALKTGTPVLPVFSMRDPDGKFRILIEEEVKPVRTGDKNP